jgi:hypothetical protein
MVSTTSIPASRADDLIAELGLVDPTDPGASRARDSAPRLHDLRGARIALLDNRKPNAAALLAELGSLLLDRDGASEIEPISKFIYSRPAAAEIVDRLAGFDAVVTAIGD